MGGAEEFRGEPTVWPHPRFGPEIKNGRSSTKYVKWIGSNARKCKRS